MFRTSYPITLLLVVAACHTTDPVDPKIESLGRATGPVDHTARRPVVEAKPVHDMGEMPPTRANPAAAGPEKIVKGEVLETMDASRYTYVHLQTDAGEAIWAAIPQAALQKGAPVEIVQSIVMENFESRTLKRTFPSIVFGNLKEAPKAVPPTPSPES